MRVAVALAAVATVALAGCTFELRDPGVTVACGAMEFEVNRGDAGDTQVAAVLAGRRALWRGDRAGDRVSRGDEHIGR